MYLTSISKGFNRSFDAFIRERGDKLFVMRFPGMLIRRFISEITELSSSSALYIGNECDI